MFASAQIVLLVEHPDDVSVARQHLNMDAVPYDLLTAEVIAGRKCKRRNNNPSVKRPSRLVAPE